MKYRTINDFDLKGKKVLLRLDLNSEVSSGKVIDGERIRAGAESVKRLKKEKARIVIIAHQGRKGDKDFLSLKQHSKILNNYTKVKFVEDIIGKKAIEGIESLKDGEALLLENVRFLDDETRNDTQSKFVKTLSRICEVYINDAFSVSHREQAS